jgi:hypothetical protein
MAAASNGWGDCQMYDHYTLEVRSGDHRHDLMDDARVHRLLREARPARPRVVHRWASMTSHLPCFVASQRYYLMLRLGLQPRTVPCS